MIIETFDNTTQEILKELEKTQKEFWNISRVTAEFLYNMIVDSHSKSVIEVGTSNGDFATILEYLPEDFKVDFAFVDANKAQYIKFFHLIEPHLNVGGYIACDNVISHASKVQTFLDDINANPNYENVVLPLPAGLSLAKKLR